ncbi:hypothetical protein V1477_005689 [Vespula maculifrons]|uniref:Uncharacterized protein n=1 Tax=Vespula maculifrons TaxID=7453 RepID=A0ABD2CLQ4_VESMC
MLGRYNGPFEGASQLQSRIVALTTQGLERCSFKRIAAAFRITAAAAAAAAAAAVAAAARSLIQFYSCHLLSPCYFCYYLLLAINSSSSSGGGIARKVVPLAPLVMVTLNNDAGHFEHLAQLPSAPVRDHVRKFFSQRRRVEGVKDLETIETGSKERRKKERRFKKIRRNIRVELEGSKKEEEEEEEEEEEKDVWIDKSSVRFS